MERSPKHRRVQPLRALRSALRLRKDKTRAIEAFELMAALRAVDDAEPLFKRYMRTTAGTMFCRERRSLGAVLGDLAGLATLPPQSLGHTYTGFMASRGLYNQELEELSQAPSGWNMGVDPDRQWFFNRLRDQHDLWHVVTGYSSDIAGEVRLQAFSFAQTGIRSQLLISVGGLLEAPLRESVGFARSVHAAYALGKHAQCFALVPWEDWLGRHLTDVRAELGLGWHERRSCLESSSWAG